MRNIVIVRKVKNPKYMLSVYYENRVVRYQYTSLIAGLLKCIYHIFKNDNKDEIVFRKPAPNFPYETCQAIQKYI